MHMKGWAELDRYLDALPANLEKNAIRQGLTAAADPPLKQARLNAPSPKIARAVTKGSPRQQQDGTFSIRVYLDERKEDGFLGYFFENGVRDHYITVPGAATAPDRASYSQAGPARPRGGSGLAKGRRRGDEDR
jgi:hypothetical protein